MVAADSLPVSRPEHIPLRRVRWGLRLLFVSSELAVIHSERFVLTAEDSPQPLLALVTLR
jgi:hypothetical protein